jgi:hypothetical protein
VQFRIVPVDHGYGELRIQNQVTRHLLITNEFAMMMALVAAAGCGNRNKAVHHEDDMATTRKTRIFVGPKILCDSPHHFPH